MTQSLKEDRKNLMEAMKNFVDINALVARCCCKYFGGEMEGEAFMEECIEMKEGMDNMKENYMKLASNRDHLLMMADMYHSALKKEEEESNRLTHELDITSNSLNNTQRSLRESKLHIYHL